MYVLRNRSWASRCLQASDSHPAENLWYFQGTLYPLNYFWCFHVNLLHCLESSVQVSWHPDQGFLGKYMKWGVCAGSRARSNTEPSNGSANALARRSQIRLSWRGRWRREIQVHCLPPPESLEKLGKILNFPFPTAWGSSQFHLNHLGHGDPCVYLDYTSVRSVNYSHISVSASLGSSVTTERLLCLLKIPRQSSQPLEEEAGLDWLREESPESDSAPAPGKLYPQVITWWIPACYSGLY